MSEPNDAESIFSKALDVVDPAERAAFLDRECASDMALRQRVEVLLKAHEKDEADGGMEKLAAQIPLQTIGLQPTSAEKPGDWIGRYKLREQIGEGGIGVVFMAQQEEPIRRNVALKVIKIGMDTKQVIARFEAERQALAMMDHPNIAKVLDAGATEAGRPYFVMELVNGIKITDYCDNQKLSSEGRLKLFIQVCQAIQHAHQKGIIHRDIKPSNVLVTERDGVPVPKVIDFGIAKATTDQQLTDKTYFTSFGQFMGTPAYMSPEQAAMNELGIDTRSDIYSLGVLLYELLTGQTPFDATKLWRAGFDEMRRIIREIDPQTPSSCFSTLDVTERKTAANKRGTDSPKLISLVRGDLDWIVMKSLQKDRGRRYQTPNELAEDVRRHIRGDPVEARPSSLPYRFRRFVARNKVAFASSTSIVVVMIIGTVVSVVQAVRAHTEAAKSAQTVTFLKQMLAGVGPTVSRGRNTLLLREILDRTAKNVAENLKGQPEVEAELRGTLGRVYSALGDYSNAYMMQNVALTLRQKRNVESLDVAESLNDLANVYYKQSRLTNSESLHRQALQMRRKLLGSNTVLVAESLSNLGLVLMARNDFSNAETAFREALAIRMDLLGTNNLDTAASLGNLGDLLSLAGNQEEGLAKERESLEMTKRAAGDDHPDVATALNDLADMLLVAGKLTEAEDTNRTALALRIKLFGTEHPDVAFSLFNLANVLAAEGRLPEAEATNRVVVAMRKRLLGDEHLDVAASLNNLGGILLRENKVREAESTFREAVAIQKKNLPAVHADIAESLGNIADALVYEGRLLEAESNFNDVLTMQSKIYNGPHAEIATTLYNLGEVLHYQGRFPESLVTHSNALAMRINLYRGQDHEDIASSLNAIGGVLKELGRLRNAEAALRQALTIRTNLLGSDHPSVAESLSDLASVLELESKLTDAESNCRAALVLRERILPDDWVTFDSRSQLGGILLAETNYAEATRLLLSGYEGIRQRETTIAVPDRPHLKEALVRLIHLFEVTGDSSRAAEWRKALEAFH